MKKHREQKTNPIAVSSRRAVKARRTPTPMSEKADQKIVAVWLDYVLGPGTWCHVANERVLSWSNKDKQSKARYLNSLYAQGMKKGFIDNLVFIPPKGYVGVAFELKRIGGDPPTEDQLKWLALLVNCGWYTFVAYGHEEAVYELKKIYNI